MFTLAGLIIAVVLLVIAFWAIGFVQNATAKKLLSGVVIIILVLWILQSFGIIPTIINIGIK